MFLSIIIATFNSSRYIDKCIHSILNQSNDNFEIIIKDNNSIDNTIEIIKNKFEKENFINYQIFVSSDSSIYEAWNIAIRNSQGEYMMFLGSDDFLSKNTINDYLIYVQENNFPSYIYSKAKKITSQNIFLNSIGKRFDIKSFKKYMSVVHTGSLHKRHLFNDYGLFDKSFKIAGDYEFLLRFYKLEKFHFIDKELLESTIGGLSEYSVKAQFEGMRAKLRHKTRNFIFIYKDTFFIILKILIKKLIYKYKYNANN